MSNIKPLYDRLVVKPIEAEETSLGGIIIPDAAKEKPTKGEVIAVGEGKFIDATGGVRAPKVKVGDKVNAGDTVVILEAMKMQNNIEAETSGTITGINVNKGDAVMEGDTLVTIA